jgi:hypothetical protein
MTAFLLSLNFARLRALAGSVLDVFADAQRMARAANRRFPVAGE